LLIRVSSESLEIIFRLFLISIKGTDILTEESNSHSQMVAVDRQLTITYIWIERL